MNAYDKLHSREIYDPNDAEVLARQQVCLEKLYDFNATRPSEGKKRAELLQEMFAEIGEGCYIEPPLRANWGGQHVHFGKKVYANFNLTLVDDTHIYIGDYVMIGPNVTISAGTHPIKPELRRKGLQYNLPVRIEDNVWVGSGVQIMPGVTIGENSIIGAGSVVTKDIPKNVVAVGNPCRVMREIGEE
ncbi:sugar O-acetyltransferase [Atopococcus tabaci]|uniref:sugar O-acetyltransferase n=1 Tax=Atopococcus tabaci TaxID=269774 RepID=UPI000412640D|nr:sugar O-acetyltransferase [Atopococcus tabaci]